MSEISQSEIVEKSSTLVKPNGEVYLLIDEEEVLVARIAARTGDMDKYTYLYLKHVYSEISHGIDYIEVISVLGIGSKQGTDPYFGLYSPEGLDPYSPKTHIAVRKMYDTFSNEKEVTNPNVTLCPKGSVALNQSYVNIRKQAGCNYTVCNKSGIDMNNIMVTFYRGSRYYDCILELFEAIIADNESDPSRNYLKQATLFSK